MQCERLSAGSNARELAAELRALVPGGGDVREAVQRILADIQARGDQALSEYTSRFDLAGAEAPPVVVDSHELSGASEQLNPAVRRALELAIENVGRVAEAGLSADRTVEFESHSVIRRSAPVQAAAVYVPGGRAPYPSTVVMGAVTARVAGVPQVAVCAPPNADGDIHPAILAACELTAVDSVYRMGGAQAVGALAYGTGLVTGVDVIVGPGNLYVQEAKRQVSGVVGIDGFAGPSDLVLVVGGDADPEPLALDLLAQAEHGPGTLVVAISDSRYVLDQLAAQIDRAPDTGALARLVDTSTVTDAIELANELAPEHVQLVGTVESHADRITRAGCLFVGAASATAFGDYIAGSNHVLPTGGAARFASALSPSQFRRSFTEVRVQDGSELARTAAPLARAEGFELHARSMESRIRENGSE